MIKILLIIFSLLVPVFAAASEREYQEVFCNYLGGRMEVVLKDKTRVDCLTETYAYEVDFAKKWAEGFGQAFHYSIMTERRPGVALIIEDPRKDLKYISILVNLVFKSKEEFEVWLLFKNKPPFLFLR